MEEIRPYKEYVSEVLSSEKSKFYSIPNYQRAYSWDREYWETLFSDIDSNENDYFVGTIITIVSKSDTHKGSFELEILDGQQRITTLSLLLLSIYNKIKSFEIKPDSEYDDIRRNLKRKFILPIGDSENQRLKLLDNDNELFKELMRQNGLIDINEIKFDRRRKNLIIKAYEYFSSQVSSYDKEEVFSFLKKVLSCTFIRIELDNRADAYLLFESLNGKSLPLTIVDLLKIEFFSKCKNDEAMGKKWEELLTILVPDDSVRHIQFILNNYRAYAIDLGFETQNITKASALKRYKEIFDKRGSDYIYELIANAKIYANIIAPDKKISTGKELAKIEKLGITQAYPFLMYMFKNSDNFSKNDIDKAIRNIGKFYVRRNISNKPQARDVSHMFLKCIKSIGSPSELLNKSVEILKENSISDNEFKVLLSTSDVYFITGVAKYLLSGLEDCKRPSPKGIERDFDGKSDNGANKWQIEHILPQDDNLNDDWVQMLGGGNVDKAKEIQEKWLHKIGNLTLTAYNSELGSQSFKKKKEYVDTISGECVGLCNGFWLNENVATCNQWTDVEIEARQNILIDEICNFIMYEDIVTGN